MGRKTFSTVYTDVSEAAGWRRTMHQDGNCELPWKDEPAYAKLHYFTLSMLRIDYMHTFHLGVARDLVGSALKIIASGKNWFFRRKDQCQVETDHCSCQDFWEAKGTRHFDQEAHEELPGVG